MRVSFDNGAAENSHPAAAAARLCVWSTRMCVVPRRIAPRNGSYVRGGTTYRVGPAPRAL